MNNQPYQSQYAAGQQRQDYYGGPNEPPQLPQQNYQNYPQNGTQAFQHNSYIPQQQQLGYPPNQMYQYQQPPPQANSYQYHANMAHNPTYRPSPAPQVAIPQHHRQQYGGMQYSQAPSPRPQMQQNPMQQPVPMQMPNQSPIHQQQNYNTYQYPSPLQHQRPSPQLPMQASPSPQLQYQMPPQPPEIQQIPRPQSRPQSQPMIQQSPSQPLPQQLPHAFSQPKMASDTQPGPQLLAQQPTPQAMQRKPSHPHLKAQQISQQLSTPSPKLKKAQKPKPQPLVPEEKPRTVLQQHKVPASVKVERSASSSSQKAVVGQKASKTATKAIPGPSEHLLIALAEEYFGAAEKLKEDSGKEHPTGAYFQLLAAGLRSLKVVLTGMRCQPAVEAAVRLRYASVLFETTDDSMDIDETLSSGIPLCQRNRLIGFRYDMIHLLVRSMYRSKPRAALKYLDTAIKDVETTRHTAWNYALRFLRATLSMQSHQQQDVYTAITQLRSISEKAASRDDYMIAALSAAVEAHIHISRNNTRDSIEQAQRALATVRRLQQTPDVQFVPQLLILTGFIDVACSLYQASTAQATTKMKAVQSDMDELLESPLWTTSRQFQVPITTDDTDYGSRLSDSGIVRRDDTGKLSLSVSWLDRDQIYGMGYMLNAITRHHKNASDDHSTSENLLKEASAMFDASDAREPSEHNAHSRQALHALVLTNRIFEQCSRNRWAAAKTLLTQFNTLTKALPEDPQAPWQALSNYLEGVTQQATGNMDAALQSYHHPSLALPQGTEHHSPYQRELALLATMNSLLIIRTPGHALHGTYANTLSALEPLATASTSKNIFSAYNFVRAAMPDLQANSSILDTKGFLQTALQAAKQTSNNQLMCIVLNILSYKFFRGVVGEQAEKSGKATQTLARKGKDSLWLSVADGALAETLEAQGKIAEAQAVWKEAVDLAARLPENMRGNGAQDKEGAGGAGGDGVEGGDGDVQMELTDQFAM